MNFFKKIFKSKSSTESSTAQKIKKQTEELPIDDSFVYHFLKKKGKFIYCTTFEEVKNNLNYIIQENKYSEILCYDYDLLKLTKQVDTNSISVFSKKLPIFTTCEHLIADNGDIMFTSNQLRSNKLTEFSDFFIVYATTSQLVKNTNEGLASIKNNFEGNLPTNISALKNYSLKNKGRNYLEHGNTNTKNLYLLLFEDL